MMSSTNGTTNQNAADTTRFTVENLSYQLDLCDEHKESFSNYMEVLVEISEAVGSRTGSTVRKALKGKKGVFTTKDVRLWLQEQGRDVAPTGRLPNELIEEYKRAHA
jgi:hypothetical protein